MYFLLTDILGCEGDQEPGEENKDIKENMKQGSRIDIRRDFKGVLVSESSNVKVIYNDDDSSKDLKQNIIKCKFYCNEKFRFQ